MSSLIHRIFIIISFICIMSIPITGLIFFFFIKEANMVNVFDIYESSPLFDFNPGLNCNGKSFIAFYTWEGRIDTEKKIMGYSNDYPVEIIRDITDITKINGHYFCYKHISYKDLLYNGQIIKDGEKCGNEYKKDCGIIDTLKQHLCIKDVEKCPLYDVGIGENKNSTDYDYNEEAEIYYNNNNYDNQNKTIIGKLLLSNGKPCYSLNERLWSKFSSREAMEEGYYKCELKIFNNTNDDRYKYKGNITYKRIYEDNLSDINKKFLLSEVREDATVELYIREFYGINKSCDEKYDLDKDGYEIILKVQKGEKVILIIEFVIIMICLLIFYIRLFDLFWKFSFFKHVKIYLLILFGILLPFIICKSVFLGIIIHYDLSYDCSDELTNEIFRKENKNVKISIKLISINLGLEIFAFLLNALYYLIFYLKDECEYEIICNCFKRKLRQQNNNNNNSNNNNNNNSNNSNDNSNNNSNAINRMNLNRNNNDNDNDNRNNNNQVERNFEQIRRIVIGNRNIMDNQSSKRSTNENTSYFSN